MKDKLKLKQWEKGQSIPSNVLSNEVSVGKKTMRISKDISEEKFQDEYVSLYYDENLKIIGLKPDKATKNSYHLRKPNQGRFFVFSPIKIIRELNIKKGRYPLYYDEENNMFFFEYEEIQSLPQQE